jgi:hypothetical protein
MKFIDAMRRTLNAIKDYVVQTYTTKEYVKTTFSNGFKGHASGKVVAINDVSPIPHTMSVRVSGINDISKSVLYRFGKNLLNPNDLIIYNDGRFGIDALLSLPKGIYTFSSSVPLNKFHQYVNGVHDTFEFDVPIKEHTMILETDQRIKFSFTRADGLSWKENPALLQLEVGLKATPYTPYVKPTEFDVLNDDASWEKLKLVFAVDNLLDNENNVTDSPYQFVGNPTYKYTSDVYPGGAQVAMDESKPEVVIASTKMGQATHATVRETNIPLKEGGKYTVTFEAQIDDYDKITNKNHLRLGTSHFCFVFSSNSNFTEQRAVSCLQRDGFKVGINLETYLGLNRIPDDFYISEPYFLTKMRKYTVVIDGSDVTIYIDGHEYGTVSNVTFPAGKFAFGAYTYSYNYQQNIDNNTGLTEGDIVKMKNIKVYEGCYKPYKADGVVSLYPSTTLMSDAEFAVIECTYNRDVNKAFADLEQKINSLGGN